MIYYRRNKLNFFLPICLDNFTSSDCKCQYVIAKISNNYQKQHTSTQRAEANLKEALSSGLLGQICSITKQGFSHHARKNKLRICNQNDSITVLVHKCKPCYIHYNQRTKIASLLT